MRGGHLGPVCNSPDMTGMAQGHGRQTHVPAFSNADLDRLRRDGLSESILSINHGKDRSVDQHVDYLIGKHQFFVLHLDIARYPHDPMTVVAGQVGADEITRYAFRFVTRTARFFEDCGNQSFEICRHYK